MQFEREPSKDARCINTAADFWIRVMHFVRGPLQIDNTRAAKLGLKDSLREIGATEEELKAELEALIARIRATQKQTKSMERLKPMLVQSKKIKGRLAVLQRKRDALDNHMETLENSELNQHVLHSMQRTSNALKAMGLDKSLQAVDQVMMDLEENHSDVSSFQQTLGMSAADDDSVDWGLELSMLLSDDCGAPPVLANAMQEAPPAVASAAAAAALAEDEEQAPEAAELKKKEPAFVEV
jgi:myosin heavy subunit